MCVLSNEQLLLGYLVVYFFVGVVYRAAVVRRMAGVRPTLIDTSTELHRFVGRAMQRVVLLTALVVAAAAVLPQIRPWLGPFEVMQLEWARSAGWGLLLATLPWIVAAQSQMGRHWRVGIDRTNETSLVVKGLFRWSRNPIFLAMRVNMLGLFLAMPTAVTLALLMCSELTVQVQVRLEEQFLLSKHGAAYENYCRQVRRWL
jgi:protein-S-isoprenylcysteine O-methyltransferase Ste14